MTNDELHKLLNDLCHSAYWYGEGTGYYGEADPETRKRVEIATMDALRNSEKKLVKFKKRITYQLFRRINKSWQELKCHKPHKNGIFTNIMEP